MDYVPPMAAITAGAQKALPAEAAALAPAHDVKPVAAPDPRSIYTLTPEAAGAVFALVENRIQVIDAALDVTDRRGTQVAAAAMAAATATTPVVSPETTKTIAAANRNWSEDVRLDHSPSRLVGTDTVVAYDSPRVTAAWSVAFPELAGRKLRAAHLPGPSLRSVVHEAEARLDDTGSDIYLLCNSAHFETIRQAHPRTHINWINVDNDEIVVVWQKPSEEG
ncbi:hypothetical protein ABID82_006007 [Methylobacterium sp. PvP062]|uniref:Uncharacterized protein n=1 Tax=Methylobacterium radiotolerans TaxID=31998 RepID=A0ABV2NMA2_9HYPH|nr:MULTISPECIES: hypothetical protein [Methylobacterium]MCX7332059.1 hypothetical protein [Hyphomicrobiales bacterium]KIU32791.1 hypothetical protein SR39_14735 [Methylobacterium radiotolerans]MBP2495678.1 hypothetical protein [Methylobacterium sp. PvP105]MBP2504451.1 hypothetical protein [Methylobacterium sp. PvP109]ONF47533.1 hypothetical protein RSM1_19030 [Methylobacterium radiotolerans]